MSDEKAGFIALATMLLLWVIGMIYFSGKPQTNLPPSAKHVHVLVRNK